MSIGFTKKMIQSIFLVLILLFISGCGYRPSAHFAKKVFGDKIYTKVDVSLATPENSVLTKDALNKALRTRLKMIVTRKKDADSMLSVKYENIRFIPLQYDKNGYAVEYQVNLKLKFTFEKDGKVETKWTIGHYEFPILPSAIIAYDVQLKAIERSSVKALDQFFAYITAKGYFVDKQK